MMRKTYQLHLRLDIELIELLKKQAQEDDISLNELCRCKLKKNSQLNRIENLLDNLSKKL